MSSTTQILFNSPALNSLKRDQLIKLCKHHGLKANGKNAELIERLKQKADELPPEAVTWKDSDEEDEDDLLMDDSLMAEQPPRPSEQWEIVMDDIEEIDEAVSKSNTLTSLQSVRSPGTPGEFGTAGSKGTVKSNLKAAIANSFGLKRAGLIKKDHNDMGTTRSLPNLPSRTDIPIAEEHPVEPIPGAPSRPGMAAPVNARLSTGSSGGITTTIRLISPAPKSITDTPPRLAPYSTKLELDMSTPSAAKNVWPPTPNARFDSGRLYPTIPSEDLSPAHVSTLKNAVVSSVAATPAKMTPFKDTSAKLTPLKDTPAKIAPFKNTPAKGTPARSASGESPLKNEMPSDAAIDIFSPTKPMPASGTAKLDIPAKPHSRLSVLQNDPFLFGSPLPRNSVTNKQFDNAAQEVLEEMNRRLAKAGVPKVEKTVLDTKGKGPLPPVPPKAQGKLANDRFKKTHEKAFDKMDSIANHYAARRPAPGAPANERVAIGKKRKSEAVAPPRSGPAAKRQNHVAQARVFSNGSQKKMTVPGGFGEENEEDEEPENVGDRRSSKRIRVAEGADVHKGRRVSLLPDRGETAEERVAEQRKRERERQALKKKIEARRRSGRGGLSAGGRAALAAEKPKPSRLGFIGTAKSLVGKVWNMGAGVSKPETATTAAVARPPIMPRTATADKGPVSQKPTASSLAKTVGPTPLQLKIPQKTDNAKRSARARSPIPSFNPPTSLAAPPGSTMPMYLRKTSNPKLPPGVGASSLGARTSTAAGPSNVSSLGSRHPTGANVVITHTPLTPETKPSIPVRKRTISTLMAPTASSLAKRAATSPSTADPSRATPLALIGESKLQQITNSAKTPRTLPARPTVPVFSSPIDAPSSPTTRLGIDENEHMSLGAGGRALMASPAKARAKNADDAEGEVGGDGDVAVPPKPQTLVARKPHISRTKVVTRVGQQRSVSNSSRASSTVPGAATPGRTRSSVGSTPRRSMGVAKNLRTPSGAGADLMMKKRVRQSEHARRTSGVGVPGATEGVRPKARVSGVAMDVDA